MPIGMMLRITTVTIPMVLVVVSDSNNGNDVTNDDAGDTGGDDDDCDDNDYNEDNDRNDHNDQIDHNDANDNESINWYDLLRYKNCILEGSKEIETNVSLPLETNLDLLGGISFEKGCFKGQEVNARIKWKGLVKRKYVPVTCKSAKLSHLQFAEHNEKKIFFNSSSPLP